MKITVQQAYEDGPLGKAEWVQALVEIDGITFSVHFDGPDYSWNTGFPVEVNIEATICAHCGSEEDIERNLGPGTLCYTCMDDRVLDPETYQQYGLGIHDELYETD